jgi:ribosomal protein S18 acetylase RimI-like enzyme
MLVQFMQRTHSEISPDQPLQHLAATVDQHFSRETPLWWALAPASKTPVGCLWLGNAIDQRSGERHAYVLLLFVDPAHRRRGLATQLLEAGQAWARQRGDLQITLQVLTDNQPALRLYQKLGYLPASVLMTRSLIEADEPPD